MVVSLAECSVGSSLGDREDNTQVQMVHCVVHLSHVSPTQHKPQRAPVARGHTGLLGLL